MVNQEYDGYSARYDAFYYVDTMQWGESACTDPSCEYCNTRPDTAHGLSNDIDQLRLADHGETSH